MEELGSNNPNSVQFNDIFFSKISESAKNNDVKLIEKIAQEFPNQIKYIFGSLYKLEYFYFF